MEAAAELVIQADKFDAISSKRESVGNQPIVLMRSKQATNDSPPRPRVEDMEAAAKLVIQADKFEALASKRETIGNQPHVPVYGYQATEGLSPGPRVEDMDAAAELVIQADKLDSISSSNGERVGNPFLTTANGEQARENLPRVDDMEAASSLVSQADEYNLHSNDENIAGIRFESQGNVEDSISTECENVIARPEVSMFPQGRHPGAFAVNGPHLSDSGSNGRNGTSNESQREPEHQRHQRQVFPDFHMAFHRTNLSSIQNAHITEANAIDDAEAVVYATSVNTDTTAKIRRIVIGLGIVLVMVIAGHSVGLTYEPNYDFSVSQKIYWGCEPYYGVFARCRCSGNNMTDGLNLLTANETKFYNDLQKLLLNENVITNYYTIGSCETENQCMVWSSKYLRRNITDETAHTALNETNTVIEAHVLCMTYLQLDGWYWQENDGWLTEGYYCDWFGVSCSFLWRWRVTAIELPSNALNGTFPSLLHHMPSLRKYYDEKVSSLYLSFS
jgi:hypothetical protein